MKNEMHNGTVSKDIPLMFKSLINVLHDSLEFAEIQEKKENNGNNNDNISCMEKSEVLDSIELNTTAAPATAATNSATPATTTSDTSEHISKGDENTDSTSDEIRSNISSNGNDDNNESNNESKKIIIPFATPNIFCSLRAGLETVKQCFSVVLLVFFLSVFY